MVEEDTTGGGVRPGRIPRRLRERIPELLVEAFSVMLAVLVALAVDAWREDRSNRELAERAQASIVEEIQTNRAELASAADSNDELLGQLGRYLNDGDEDALSGFDFSFSLLTSAAWQTAQMTRAAHFLDFDWVTRVARLYDLQELYDRAQSAVVDEFGAGGPDEAQLEEFLRKLQARISLAATLQDELLEAYEEVLTESGSGAGDLAPEADGA